MAESSIRNRAVFQLIQTPESSRLALQRAVKGETPRAPPAAEFPVAQARSWAKTVLQTRYRPPKGTVFLPISQENGRFDVIRAVWKVGETQVEVAQTVYLISIRLSGLQLAADLPALKRAEAAAKQVLSEPERIHFEQSGPFHTGLGGEQTAPQHPSEELEFPDWLDRLFWWMDKRDVGFVSVKLPGGPTREIITPAEYANRYWFTVRE